MLALNTAFAPSGADITLAAGASLPEPVEVLNFVTGGVTSAVTTRDGRSIAATMRPSPSSSVMSPCPAPTARPTRLSWS